MDAGPSAPGPLAALDRARALFAMLTSLRRWPAALPHAALSAHMTLLQAAGREAIVAFEELLESDENEKRRFRRW